MSFIIFIGAAIGFFCFGWQSHSIYLRKLSKMSARIRRVQHGGKWHGK